MENNFITRINKFLFNNENDSNTTITCGPAFNIRNTSSRFEFGEGWEGIPVNLVINTVVFTVMIILFICLRKRAWNSKSRQLKITHKGWIQFIYGDRDEETNVKQIRKPHYTEHHVHDLIQVNPLLPPDRQSIASPLITRKAVSNGDENKRNGNNTLKCNEITVEITPNGSDRGESIYDNIDTAATSTITITSNKTNNSDHYEPVIETTPANNKLPNEEPKISGERPESTQARINVFGYRILDALLIKDSDILAQKGSDAVQYLLFQRYIIYFLSFLTVVCVCIILPINLQGTLETKHENKRFARTTISNLEPESPLLWIHLVISVLIVPIGLLLMCHFSRTIKVDDEQIVRRTLFIRRIPKSKRNKEILINYFQTHFNDIVIEGIQFVYDIRKLNSLHSDYDSVTNAKLYCEEYLTEYGKRCRVKPYFLGHLSFLLCGCGCENVDALNYYSNREQELEQNLEKEFRHIISHPSGSIFITFQTEKMAQKVYRVLRQNQEKSCTICPCCNCCFRIGFWTLRTFNCLEDDDFKARRWSVSYAPYPDDINWEDSAVDYKMLWLRRILIHLLLFVLFFFLSTPAIFLSVLNYIKLQETLSTGLSHFSPLLTEYVSPLLMVIASVILPTFVTLFCQYLPYKTISELNHSIMWKVFLFLVMMVIILPSLGLTSAKALIDSIANNNAKLRWQCLFPVDNGAFFVNYVLQSSLLGNAMELLRFPELFLYFFYLIFSSRTKAEYEGARKMVIFDFAFGVRYPRYLLIFTMVVTYSLSCPLVVPCGLVYMVIKHLVDRYNIYYVYTPSKISGRIHSTAIMFFHIAILMMQFQMFAFSILRNADSDVTHLSMITFLLTFLVFAGHCFYHFFWNINHLTYSALTKKTKKDNKRKKHTHKKREFCACSYLPKVLYSLNVNGIVSTTTATAAATTTNELTAKNLNTQRNYGAVKSEQNGLQPNNSSQKLSVSIPSLSG